MAVLFKCLYRHKSEKQKLTANFINSSNSWAGIDDLCSKYAALLSGNLGNKKSPTAIGLNYK